MSDTQTTSDDDDRAIPDYDDLVIARMVEFFDHRTPWHRGLWHVGTILGLQEVVEYGEIVEAGQGSEGLTYVCESMRRVCSDDPGLGGASIANEICQHLAGDRPKFPQTRSSIRQLVRRCREDYSSRWATAVEATPADRPAVELTARRVSAHLLDEGFSGDHLHGWLTKVSTNGADRPPLAILLREAEGMLEEGEHQHAVLVPLSDTPRGAPRAAAPDGQLAPGLRYLDQQQALAWIEKTDGRMSRRPPRRYSHR